MQTHCLILLVVIQATTVFISHQVSTETINNPNVTATTTTAPDTNSLQKQEKMEPESVMLINNATSGNLVQYNTSNSQAISAANISTSSEPLIEEMALQLRAEEVPRSERQPILNTFERFFSKPRSHEDQQQKEFVREGVVRRLRELGFETSFLQKSRFEFRRRPAASYNIISILPGRYRQTKQDKIVLLGAHWDSFTSAPGVDDNGSGSTCLLEIARVLSANRCRFNHTIMLVWFDYEEHGKYGSEFFVNDYLYPFELDKYHSKFIGAYILDMILVKEKENDTQTLPMNLRLKLPEFTEELEREKNRGDFLATWARKTYDEPLENVFRSSWISLGFESRTFKAMRPELPQSRLPNSEERYDWKDFFRSDHASFWFPPLISNAVRRSPNRPPEATSSHASLNAILLTDLGPWRKSYQRCYHSACDDQHFLTDGNLGFMQQVTDTLIYSIMKLGQGQCSGLNQNIVRQSNNQQNIRSITQLMMLTATSSNSTLTTQKSSELGKSDQQSEAASSNRPDIGLVSPPISTASSSANFKNDTQNKS